MGHSSLELIWANKPGCSKAVAEFWIGKRELWFTLFIDDGDDTLKVEILPTATGKIAHAIALEELERLIEHAKLEMLAMTSSSALSV